MVRFSFEPHAETLNIKKANAASELCFFRCLYGCSYVAILYTFSWQNNLISFVVY